MITMEEYDLYYDSLETKEFVPVSDEEVKAIVDRYVQMGPPDKLEIEVYMDLWTRRV